MISYIVEAQLFLLIELINIEQFAFAFSTESILLFASFAIYREPFVGRETAGDK
jgi:hypothetical protein